MSNTTLDLLMSRVIDCLSAASLNALDEVRATPEAEARVAWLAERANEGQLTPAERAEYETCILFANFLGILQSTARRELATG